MYDFCENKMLDIVAYYKPLSERRKLVNTSLPILPTENNFTETQAAGEIPTPRPPNDALHSHANMPPRPPETRSADTLHSNVAAPSLLVKSPRQDDFKNIVQPTSSMNKRVISAGGNRSHHRPMRLDGILHQEDLNNHQVGKYVDERSSLNSSSLSSKLSHFDKTLIDKSASQLLQSATTAEGQLDYETLKVLLRHQRKAYKKKLEEEKIKREALEEFIVKIGTPRKNETPRRSNRATEDRSEISSSDTNSLLVNLLEQYHLRSKSRRRWARRSASTSSTLRSDLDIEPGKDQEQPSRLLHRSSTINGTFVDDERRRRDENFYESTSLFSLPNGYSARDEYFQQQDVLPENFGAQLPVVDSSTPNNVDNEDILRVEDIESIRSMQVANGAGPFASKPPPPPVVVPPLLTKNNSSGSGSTASNYSSARRRRSKDVTHRRRQSSRHSRSTATSSEENGGSKISTNRSANFVKKPSVAFFVPVGDDELASQTHEETREKKRKAFAARSMMRRSKIEAANVLRRELAHRSRQLAEQVIIGKMSMKEAGVELNLLPEPTAFPRSEMIESSRKKFQSLPEVRRKREQMQQEFESLTNRIRAKMYLQKQQYRALIKPQHPR